MRAGNHLPLGYMFKGIDPSLNSLLRLAFERLDQDVDDVVHELFRRLPAARVVLVRGDGDQLDIEAPVSGAYRHDEPLHARVFNWLEDTCVTA